MKFQEVDFCLDFAQVPDLLFTARGLQGCQGTWAQGTKSEIWKLLRVSWLMYQTGKIVMIFKGNCFFQALFSFWWTLLISLWLHHALNVECSRQGVKRKWKTWCRSCCASVVFHGFLRWKLKFPCVQCECGMEGDRVLLQSCSTQCCWTRSLWWSCDGWSLSSDDTEELLLYWKNRQVKTLPMPPEKWDSQNFIFIDSLFAVFFIRRFHKCFRSLWIDKDW